MTAKEFEDTYCPSCGVVETRDGFPFEVTHRSYPWTSPDGKEYPGHPVEPPEEET